MSRGDLILAIEKAIGVLSQIYRNDADESDLYEASLLVLALEAAQSAGGTVLLTQDGSAPASALRFRRAPGNLWSGDFTYPACRSNWRSTSACTSSAPRGSRMNAM